jgi:hypothetical protein
MSFNSKEEIYIIELRTDLSTAKLKRIQMKAPKYICYPDIVTFYGGLFLPLWAIAY